MMTCINSCISIFASNANILGSLDVSPANEKRRSRKFEAGKMNQRCKVPKCYGSVYCIDAARILFPKQIVCGLFMSTAVWSLNMMIYKCQTHLSCAALMKLFFQSWMVPSSVNTSIEWLRDQLMRYSSSVLHFCALRCSTSKRWLRIMLCHTL